jgi:hypothetical protein
MRPENADYIARFSERKRDTAEAFEDVVASTSLQ